MAGCCATMGPTSDTLEDTPPDCDGPGPRAQAYLFLVLECDRPSAGGARYSLEGIDEVVIGRGEERRAHVETSGGVQRLRLSVPGRSLSSLHARLTCNAAGVVLEDARSTNGSFVNGERVTRAQLSDGDVLDLGHTLFLIRTRCLTFADTAPVYDWLHDRPGEPELATLRPDL